MLIQADRPIERDPRFNWVVPGVKVKVLHNYREDAAKAGQTRLLSYLPDVGETYTIDSVLEHQVHLDLVGVTLRELKIFPYGPDPERVRIEVRAGWLEPVESES